MYVYECIKINILSHLMNATKCGYIFYIYINYRIANIL